MPAISTFYGIVITMYFLDQNQHHTPHFHASYGEYAAVFSIPDADLLAGSMPRRQLRLIQAWAELHQQELVDNWNSAVRGGSIAKIPGLQ